MPLSPLLVHLVFHPASTASHTLARELHQQLNGDALVPGLRVPTVFSAWETDGSPARPLPLEQARLNLVVVLADDELNADEAWCDFVAAQWQRYVAPPTGTTPSARFVPMQMSQHAYPLHPRLNRLSFAKAFLQPEAQRTAWVLRRVVVELCRYLGGLEVTDFNRSEAPVRVFLSHTKADMAHGPKVASQVIECLRADQPIKAWFDSGDIPTGSPFADEIRKGVEDCSLLVLLTEAYASREWCREEVLLAKEHQRPVVVVDAIDGCEERSFPYLGNVPRIRWNGDPQSGIDLLLLETLRHQHARALLEVERQLQDVIFARPPELATLVGRPAGNTVLYPDPPVGLGEHRRLARAGVPFTTPLQRKRAQRALAGKTIALSMSESGDLHRFGMDAKHFEACRQEVSRHLLIQGATLAYGGHLGSDGYTQALFELVKSHNDLEGIQPYERIVNHLGWPLQRPSAEQRSALKALCQTEPRPRPDDVDETLHADFVADPAFFPADRSPAHRYAWARGMTEMRAWQADRDRSHVMARVVMGGTLGPVEKVQPDGSRRVSWYAGRIPGVLEEIWLSVRSGQPVFLVGAFGGAAGLVIDLLRGKDREEATWAYQQHAPHAQEMRELHAQRGQPWVDYPQIIADLRSAGLRGLNPLLDEDEQQALFDAVDPMRIVELIMRLAS